jgi:rhodanese-related sulfurtransferase
MVGTRHALDPWNNDEPTTTVHHASVQYGLSWPRLGAPRLLARDGRAYAMIGRRTVHDLLASARRRYVRIDAARAWAAMANGALLIDVRDGDQRRRDGTIPGALIIDRTVLEWRVDPDSGATHRALGRLDQPLILICHEGYSSSLAVASLLDLGATAVTDVIGGFQAWVDAGLPVTPSRPGTAR